ncbi:O-acetylhomoserine aminocarboxypropyltransferase/cysteine synthase family protein [Pectinatus sottacetonis]|uniref:O-acetylhomoserine aminocarboxypropyltransferase/cysteine synthase family protein n=1 Tax=Pectinatus sottacetonis TaxID=1002795 RepID=UPI0018C6D49E|nr:aminotransferase class I/II-fold pyridoxal phosphate-dependent enzyme [Pectinatus sottacetonis]
MKFATKLLHAGTAGYGEYGSTTLPICQTTAFKHDTAEEMEAIFTGEKAGFVYSRVNNPTVSAFERRLAELEEGKSAAACSSGMAAISLAVLNIVKSGDEIISGSGIFGGTYSFFGGLYRYGIKTVYPRHSTAECFEKYITDKTRLIFIEAIGNPKLDVPDIVQIAAFAHKYGLPLMVDSTSVTPYLMQAINYGADIVIHSTSKFINGGGNSIGGIIIDSGRFVWEREKYPLFKNFSKFGSFCYMAKLRAEQLKDYGSCMAPLNAYLTNTGLDTLAVRMDRICDNANKLARYLKICDKVQNVNYPGLTDHPDYETAKKQFGGRYGAILTIRVGTKEKAFSFINNLKYVFNAANIGDSKTLVIHPASTIYAADSDEQKVAAGIYDDLVRICVGLEDIDDIQADFGQALNKI